MIRMLILRPGSTAPEVLDEYGDYDRWFVDAMAGLPCAFDTVDATRNPVPPLHEYGGVIVTGSTSAAYRREAWMEPLAAFLSGDEPPVPVLAVCFGAQLLAAARGGEVALNPHGWEIGRVEVELTGAAREDPLFAGMPGRISMLSTHEDRIERLPAGATLLAGNRCAPVQAFRAGRSVWGVQFHPEATPPILDRLIRLRMSQLLEDAHRQGRDAQAWVSRLLSDLEAPDDGHGRRVLGNFVEVCAAREATRPA